MQRCSTSAYYDFDLLHIYGFDLTGPDLTERHMRLPQVMRDSGVLMSIELPGTAPQVIKALGLEAVVAKRRDSSYEPGERSGAWVKLKIDKR